MSRNVYTFAVIAPSLEHRLRALLRTGHEGVTAAANLIRTELVSIAPPTVAYYREIMDGWNSAHTDAATLWPDLAGFDCTLEADACWWLAGNAAPVQPHPRRLRAALRGSDAGAYARRAFIAAMSDLLTFHAATRCTGVILWQCVGASCDDDQFRAT